MKIRVLLSSLVVPETPVAPVALAPFEQVYLANFAFAWRSLRRLGVPTADVPDAVQDVFLVVHRKLSEFDGRAPMTSWIYAICLRVASDRRRRASTRYEVLGDPSAGQVPSTSAGGADDLAERRALLEAALDAMPLQQRTVFTLFELEGMTGVEIAALLGVPVPTVHSRLRLAREAFRAIIARDDAPTQLQSSAQSAPTSEKKP